MKVFLSLPMNGKSDEWIMDNIARMIANYNAVSKEDNDYIHTFRNQYDFEFSGDKKAIRLWYLGEAIKKLGRCNIILFHPEWYKARGCRVEDYVATKYDIDSYSFAESQGFLDAIIETVVRPKPSVKANIRRIVDDLGIWTPELFVKTPIEDFENLKGVGSVTIHYIEELKNKLKDKEN